MFNNNKAAFNTNTTFNMTHSVAIPQYGTMTFIVPVRIVTQDDHGVTLMDTLTNTKAFGKTLKDAQNKLRNLRPVTLPSGQKWDGRTGR